MNNEVRNFCSRLNIKFCEELVPFYSMGQKLMQERGGAITDTVRLIRLNDKYYFFRKWFDDVLAAAKKVENDNDLLLFTYILYCIVRDKAPLEIIEMPDRKSLETDFAPMFSLLFFLEEMIEKMEQRGLPHDVISDTLQGFDAEINDYFDMFGRSGMRIYVGWFLLFVRGEIIRVGRLNFQFSKFDRKIRAYSKGNDVKILIDGDDVHKNGMIFGSLNQSDEDGKYFATIEEHDGSVSGFAANEYGEVTPEKVTLHGYKEFLRFGDDIINVHIPAHEPFTPQLCEESIAKMRNILQKFYPQYDYKAFCCFSWMLEKRLRSIIGKDTNITRFADMFTAFPIKSLGTGVYSFLYHLNSPLPPMQLPENNSMQRSVKKYLCDGNAFYEKCGVIPR